MNDVWNTLDGISGEDTPPPIDILSFYSALSQRLKSTLDVTLPKNKKDARKEGLITYQNNTIWPWIKGLWKTVNELTGESADLPKKLSDLRHGLSDRIHQLNVSIDERIKLERQDALQKYKKETVEPNYLQQQNTIAQQEKNLAEKNKEVSELHIKNKNMEKLLDAIGLSHPVIKLFPFFFLTFFAHIFHHNILYVGLLVSSSNVSQ